jgi:hypothetical protein
MRRRRRSRCNRQENKTFGSNEPKSFVTGDVDREDLRSIRPTPSSEDKRI